MDQTPRNGMRNPISRIPQYSAFELCDESDIARTQE